MPRPIRRSTSTATTCDPSVKRDTVQFIRALRDPIRRGEITSIPSSADGPVIVATGPLTSDPVLVNPGEDVEVLRRIHREHFDWR